MKELEPAPSSMGADALAAIDQVDWSSSLMVRLALAVSMLPALGLLRVRLKVSLDSRALSWPMATWTVCWVCPAAKVRVWLTLV